MSGNREKTLGQAPPLNISLFTRFVPRRGGSSSLTCFFFLLFHLVLNSPWEEGEKKEQGGRNDPRVGSWGLNCFLIA